MKVIFLDIDGVLSSFGGSGLCGTRLDLFADIVKQTGAEVVLSSTWRLTQCREQRMRLQSELYKRGVEMMGHTPFDSNLRTRGDEIQTWLNGYRHAQEKVGAFVILDDDPNDEMGKLKPNLVKCDGYQGLTPAIAAEVVSRLNNGEAQQQ